MHIAPVRELGVSFPDVILDGREERLRDECADCSHNLPIVITAMRTW